MTSVAALLGGAALAWADAKSDLREGIDLLRRGRTQEANAKFRAVLAADPSNEDAYSLVRETDHKVFLDMLVAGGDAEQTARRLLSLSGRVEVERSRDPAAIKALVQEAITSRELDKRESAARKLAAAHGQHAVPELLPYLGSNDVETRANAILALSRIGSDAVLPLAAAVDLGNEVQRQNVVKLLQRIGDERSEPAVARAMGDKKAAHDKCVGVAKRYFTGDQDFVRAYDRTFVIWSVKDGQLVGREVPRFVYNFELAEQAAYDALALDPSCRDARAMIVLANVAEKVAHENLSAEAKGDEKIQAYAKSLEGVDGLAAAAGAGGLLDAFRLGMELKAGDAAARVADLIPTVWDGREIVEGNPLVQGLTSEDNKIRYAAAIALLRIDPPKAFPKSNMVAQIAGDAAASRAVRQVLVIDSDTKNAMNVQRALNQAGFHAVAANSGAEGLSMAKATGGFDAVVISSKLSDLSPFAVLAELGRDFRTSNAKKVVMAAGADLGENKATYDKFNISGVAPTSADSVGVVNVVKESLGSAEGDAGRIRANRLSIAASNAIAGSCGAAFNRKDAQKGLLVAAGEGADPEVALAAHGALAKVATPDAQAALRAVIANTANPPAQRIAAGRSLAAALRGQTPAPETFTALVDAMGDADAGVRTAAGTALGAAKLTPQQQLEVMNKRRVD